MNNPKKRKTKKDEDEVAVDWENGVYTISL
jgi:hypothetical protein